MGFRKAQHVSGFALIEAIIATGITTLLVLIICSFAIYSSHSFAALFNYVDLDDSNRNAMDRITRDVRQAARVKAWTTNSLTLVGGDNVDIEYVYTPTARTLTRRRVGQPTVTLLEECDRLMFTLGQRNPVGGTFDIYNPSSMDVVKVVNVSWQCSREILGRRQNTESVQTARIVIRKQGT
jgi:hypothetical protein